MERLRRVAQVWSWLPAFRAVGETQHMRRAAETLHIAPSALSRTVGLVEDDVGASLFRRAGRRIALTNEGEALLNAVRDAMRIVHDALAKLDAGALSGEVGISAPGTITRMYVIPALERLRGAHPNLRPALRTAPHAELGEQLRRGDLDVAFTTNPIDDAALTIFALGRFTSGVYCGREHPLFRKRKVGIEAVQACAFVAPPLDDSGHPLEGWPVELARTVDVVAGDLQVGVEVCRAGRHLAVLPDGIAKPEVKHGELKRIAIEVIPPTPFFACHRRSTGTHSPAEALVDAMLAVLAPTARL